uniref:Uncharacterized protein n=1 Tax=Panagrellus redivivus TaxID=6233 RepID=A0A7E4VSG0_PANRE
MMSQSPPPKQATSAESDPSKLTLDAIFDAAAVAFNLTPERRALVAKGENFPTPKSKSSSPAPRPTKAGSSDDAKDGWPHLDQFTDEEAPIAVFDAVAQRFGNSEMLDTIWNETMFKVPLDDRLNNALKARKLSEYEVKFKDRYNDDSFYDKEDVPEPFMQWPMKSCEDEAEYKTDEVFDYSD